MSERAASDRIGRLEDELRKLRDQSAVRPDNGVKMMVSLAEIKLDLANQDKVLARIEEDLNGNGKIGLKEEVRSLKQSYRFQYRVFWGAYSAVLLAIFCAAATWLFEKSDAQVIPPTTGRMQHVASQP